MSAFRVLGISWAGIGTRDYAATHALLRDVLGLAVVTETADQAIFAVGGQQLELFGRGGHGRDNNSPPSFAFEVDDFDAALAALRGAGVELVGEPGEWNGHRWQYFRTPDGYLLSIKVSPYR